jgi:hypothetical protein
MGMYGLKPVPFKDLCFPPIKLSLVILTTIGRKNLTADPYRRSFLPLVVRMTPG